MKSSENPSVSSPKRKRGMALVTVVSVVTILTILVVAMLSLSESERTSSVKYADGEHARSLSDSAINIAMGQIWAGTNQDAAGGGERLLWASQPGAIRSYRSNGAFYKGYKLYSDDTMVVNAAGTAGEQTMAEDYPDTAWANKPGMWVDLNEPVVVQDKNGDGKDELIFPILDPRAFIRSEYTAATGISSPNSTNIEGFSYQTTMPGVVDASTVDSTLARLPMPVQWLFMLKDGTLGNVTTSGSGATTVYNFVSASGVVPTEENPIVGRIAFWTDDESSKLNINTASEPTFWSTPLTYHDRDYEWAIYQPTRYEYQRYPGHPATIALSTVLFPNRDLDVYGKSGSTTPSLSDVLAMKERIYDIMPKINRGGSVSGTVPFWASSDPLYSGTRMTRVDIASASKKHLYASVDELLFSSTVAGGERLTHDNGSVRGGGPALFSGVGNSPSEERALERMRFFLTAHSKSPETTLFGTPRVAIWPVANENSGGKIVGNPAEYRTIFDNLIAYCNQLGTEENSYYFRRADNVSPTYDANIPRNRKLLNYLYSLMERDFPSGGVGSDSFTDKYGGRGSAQLLALIFDYIRCTNLYDGILAPKREDLIREGGDYWLSGSDAVTMKKRDTLRATKTKTFTPDRASGNVDLGYTDTSGTGQTNREKISYTAFSGHGQVTPAEATISGHVVKGLGRFPVLSEVGLHFIATADGTNDEGSWIMRKADGTLETDNALRSGGRTSPRLASDAIPELGGNAIQEIINDPSDPTGARKMPGRWYSNFAPYPEVGQYGTVNDPTSPRHFAKHPGFDALNWNMTLLRNGPLQQDQRRVQAMLSLEFTVPAGGFTGIYPDFTVEITDLNNLRIKTAIIPTQLFTTLPGGKYYWRAQRSMFQTTHNRENGSSVGPAAMTQSRHIKALGNMPADPSYNEAVLGGGNTYEGHLNFDLVSNFFSMPGYNPSNPGSGTFRFMGGGNFTINIYTGRDVSAQNLVQTYRIQMGNAGNEMVLPTPELVVMGTAKEEFLETSTGITRTQERIEAPRWWAFNYGGAIGRHIGIWDPADPILRQNGMASVNPVGDSANPFLAAGRTLGRFYSRGSGWGSRYGIPRYDSLMWAYNSDSQIYPSGTGTLERYGWYAKPRQLGVYAGNLSNSARTGAPGESGKLGPNIQGPFGQDTVLSIVPKHGDIRLLGVKKEVPSSEWEMHPLAGKNNSNGEPIHMAHSFMRFSSDYEPGRDVGTNDAQDKRLVYGARYSANTGARPDLPQTSRVGEAQLFGDFDTGSGSMRDGPWINKPDEGNTGLEMKSSTVGANNIVRTPTAYYDEMWRSSEAGEAFVSPNRMVSSAGMFGSLPTGVVDDIPWRTLLFRPWAPMPGQAASMAHQGAPNYTASSSDDTSKSPFSGKNPADHLITDLFWMPIVEPYAISEAFSTAGKVNMNYQMVPFNNYIRRTTAVQAAMKGELIHAFPTAHSGQLHSNPGGSQYVRFENEFGTYHYRAKWSDQDSKSTSAYYTGTPNKRFWHRKIDMDGTTGIGVLANNNATLGQFDDRFSFKATVPNGAKGLFRTASQICEIWLVPKKVAGSSPVTAAPTATLFPTTDGSDPNSTTRYSYKTMNDFWKARAVTGDNAKERPYANLLAKFTTQSNSYRIHYRVQTIRKARSKAHTVFDPSADSVTSDYRGSAVIERYLDASDPRIPNYGDNPNAAALTNFYNFRVLENKRFAP